MIFLSHHNTDELVRSAVSHPLVKEMPKQSLLIVIRGLFTVKRGLLHLFTLPRKFQTHFLHLRSSLVWKDQQLM